MEALEISINKISHHKQSRSRLVVGQDVTTISNHHIDQILVFLHVSSNLVIFGVDLPDIAIRIVEVIVPCPIQIVNHVLSENSGHHDVHLTAVDQHLVIVLQQELQIILSGLHEVIPQVIHHRVALIYVLLAANVNCVSNCRRQQVRIIISLINW